jgi:hypothetical protein
MAERSEARKNLRESANAAMICMLGRKAQSGGPVGSVVRGGSWNNNDDNVRAAYRNRNDNINHNDNLGFRVGCVSAMFFRPSCGLGRWRSRRRGANGDMGVRVPEMQRDYGFVAEAKQEEQRRACLVCTHAERQRDTRASRASGVYKKLGRAWVTQPRTTRPRRLC